MKGICPNCEKESDLTLIHSLEDIEVRGEKIKVEVDYFKCSLCGEEFDDPRSENDPLEKAYREYRCRHGMMQPEEIRNLRAGYGLTQHEMAKILGWGLATLSRYENGALQDEAHDKTLRLAMEPHNLLKLIEETPSALPDDKKRHIIEQLQSSEEMIYDFTRIFEERFGRYAADELSGYKKLDLAKVFNAILFFCKNGIYKTFLNKLLFYSDFKHFKENTISMTGSQYAKATRGPVPEKWEYYISLLIDEKSLLSDEVFISDEITGEKFSSLKEPDLSIFDNSELLVLTSVKDYFKDWTATRISDFSHNEEGYIKTQMGHPISYNYAKNLQI
jgi:putative zinc finger/helix-turn-helix YgiT family protein